MKDFNWDEMKEKLEKAVKLEKNDSDLTVKMTMLESEDIKEDQMIGKMLKGEDEMKQSFGQFLGKKGPLDCDIELNDEEKYIVIKLKNKKDLKAVYKLLNDMFFGEFFKKMIDAMMQAFGGMFGKE